jgi:S-adenosylmethionine:tRNA ribosyltransferase-isomerase
LPPGPPTTDLFIRPPHSVRGADHLITNFHLPRSSLLMLVAAFAGYDLMRHAYDVAIAEGYRFYSYGDAMCIL